MEIFVMVVKSFDGKGMVRKQVVLMDTGGVVVS